MLFIDFFYGEDKICSIFMKVVPQLGDKVNINSVDYIVCAKTNFVLDTKYDEGEVHVSLCKI